MVIWRCCKDDPPNLQIQIHSTKYVVARYSLPGAVSHPPREEPRDGRADGGERLHGGADGGRDPRYRRVGATVLRDDVAVQILGRNSTFG